MNLKSKVAVVTGAASGIGREIARTFWVDRAKVVIADLNQAGAAAAAAELGDADSAIGIGTAVTDESRWRPVWQRPSLLLGIDMLVSNAGIRLAQRIDRSGRQKRAFVVSGSHACFPGGLPPLERF